MAGLWLAAGAMAFESLAGPALTDGSGLWRDALQVDGWLLDGVGRPPAPADLSAVPGFTLGDIPGVNGAGGRWAGLDEIPINIAGAHADLPAQFENAFSQGGALYQEMLRKRAYAGPNPGGGPDTGFGGLVDSVLRNAWDSVAEDNHTANLSLAGFELSLTLRSDQRSLMVNGYDVLPALQHVQSLEIWQGSASAAARSDGADAAATSPAPVLSRAGHHGGNLVTDAIAAFEGARRFVTHPLTIFFALTFLTAWLSVRVMHALRERRRSYGRYRR